MVTVQYDSKDRQSVGHLGFKELDSLQIASRVQHKQEAILKVMKPMNTYHDKKEKEVIVECSIG